MVDLPDSPGGDPADALSQLLGGGGMEGLLGMAQQMQQQLLDAQEALESTTIEGTSGGGMVTIRATGDLRFSSVHIDPRAVDPADVEMLNDLVLAALVDLTTRLAALQQPLAGPFGAMTGLGTAIDTDLHPDEG